MSELFLETTPSPGLLPTEPAGTFSASDADQGFDPGTSVLIERRTTATREVYENPDGTCCTAHRLC